MVMPTVTALSVDLIDGSGNSLTGSVAINNGAIITVSGDEDPGVDTPRNAMVYISGGVCQDLALTDGSGISIAGG